MAQGPEHDRLPEEPRFYDAETARIILSDIESLALDLELDIVTRPASPLQAETGEELSGAELDRSIADLSASTIKDIREFERREGYKDGLQAAAEIVRRALESS